MIKFSDFVTKPFVPAYLQKISDYGEKTLQEIFNIYDKIDNMTQFDHEFKKIISHIDDKKERSNMVRHIHFLQYAITVMVGEKIDNKNIDVFFKDSIPSDSVFIQALKNNFNNVFIERYQELTSMNDVLNKDECSLLDYEYDCNLRSTEYPTTKKPIPVVTLHITNPYSRISVDCSIRDIDCFIEELKELKHQAQKVGEYQ